MEGGGARKLGGTQAEGVGPSDEPGRWTRDASAPVQKRFGALFCGGSSKRMGRDKALLPWEGQPLLARGIRILRDARAEVFLASGSQERYAEFGLPCALDRESGLGPLGGLEAALAFARERSAAPAQDVLLALACDMPHASAPVFDALFKTLADGDLCLLRSASGHEPLFGVYRLGVLCAVREALESGMRRMDAIHAALDVRFLDTDELPAADYASNLNTPEDYREGERS